MGKMIEKIALERNHTITGILDINDSWDSICKENIDVAIDFTTPNSVMNNIKTCLDKNIPLVVGTTGWYDNIEKVKTFQITCSIQESKNYGKGKRWCFFVFA